MLDIFIMIAFWFKEMPLVLIDRDRIYPDIEDEIFGRRRIRQIPEVYN